MVLYQDRMKFFCVPLFLIRPRFLMAFVCAPVNWADDINQLLPFTARSLSWDPMSLRLLFYMLNILLSLKVITVLLPILFILPTVSLLRCCSLFLLGFYIPKDLSIIYNYGHYTTFISSPRSLINIQNKISPWMSRGRADYSFVSCLSWFLIQNVAMSFPYTHSQGTPLLCRTQECFPFR